MATSSVQPLAAPPLEQLAPMLLGERDGPFDALGWTHELKFDGVRMLAEIEGKRVRLQTSDGTEATRWFPELLEPLSTLAQGRHVLDGEVCVLDTFGRPDFDRLQARAKRRGYREGDDVVVYCVFDLLVYRGLDVRAVPLASRKEMLRRLLRRDRTFILRVQDIPGHGVWLFHQARELELEGIVSKRLDSLYHSGERSDDWVKVKRPGAVPAHRVRQGK